MKKISLLVALVGIMGLGTSVAFASESGHHNHGEAKKGAKMGSGHHAKEGKEVTLEGRLIGMTCFIKHGTEGKAHKSCAKDCAEKGLPIALKVDGTLYQVSGDGHKSLVDAYKPLLKYMEDNVKVKGTIFEKGGVKMLVVNKIKNS